MNVVPFTAQPPFLDPSTHIETSIYRLPPEIHEKILQMVDLRSLLNFSVSSHSFHAFISEKNSIWEAIAFSFSFQFTSPITRVTVRGAYQEKKEYEKLIYSKLALGTHLGSEICKKIERLPIWRGDSAQIESIVINRSLPLPQHNGKQWESQNFKVSIGDTLYLLRLATESKDSRIIRIQGDAQKSTLLFYEYYDMGATGYELNPELVHADPRLVEDAISNAWNMLKDYLDDQFLVNQK